MILAENELPLFERPAAATDLRNINAQLLYNDDAQDKTSICKSVFVPSVQFFAFK